MEGKSTVLHRLFEKVSDGPESERGSYDEEEQTWSHREADAMSPVKVNQED